MKSLEMLVNLDEKKLENAKPNELQEVDSFLEQLGTDYESIKSVLLSTERRNLKKALWENEEIYPKAFTQESIDKLSKIKNLKKNESLLKKNDSMLSLIDKLSCGIKTVQNDNISWKIRGHLKKIEHVNNIIEESQELKYSKSLEVFINFSREVQTHFSNKNEDDKGEILSFLADFRGRLNSLDFINKLSVTLSEFNSKTNNQEDNLTFDALSDGLTVFKKLLNVNDIMYVEEYDPTEEMEQKNILQIRNLILDSLPSNIEKRKKAEKFIKIMEEDCKECEKHLHDIISKEAENVSDEIYMFYFDKKMNKLDVDKLSADVCNNDCYFRKNLLKKHPENKPSNDLIVAAKSYQATKRLHETLTSKKLDPIKKLENYKNEYYKEETNEALKSNPDSKVKSFFKKAGYYLANFFTLGKIKHSLLDLVMSPQQQLDQRVTKKLGEAYEVKLLLKR